MANKLYQIILHREHKNAYCDMVATHAAEMNGGNTFLPIKNFYQIIQKNLSESGQEGMEVTFDEENSTIFIDVKKEDGKYYTGVAIIGGG